MEENILDQLPDFKLHKKQTITICTFLTGPLVAGFLIAENFNQLNEKRNVIKTWILTIFFTIILLFSIFIPAFDNIPNFLFAVFHAMVAAYCVQRFQQAKIVLHQQKGGQFFSVWRAVLASFIGLVVMMGLIFLVLIIAEPGIFDEPI